MILGVPGNNDVIACPVQTTLPSELQYHFYCFFFADGKRVPVLFLFYAPAFGNFIFQYEDKNQFHQSTIINPATWWIL